MEVVNSYEDANQIDFYGKVSMGTSLIAVEFDGGVVIGADSRTSSGSYIANRVTDKLTRITDHIYCCRSGSAADTQAIANIVEYRLYLHSIELNENPPVKHAAKVFQDICYSYKDQLTAGIICAGWDEIEGGQVYSIPLGGMLARRPVAIAGSGSTYISGYVDSRYKPGMAKDECVDIVVKSLSLAMNLDGSSGGVIRYGVITKDGIDRHLIMGDKLPHFT
ncbi:proteasome subunit beta type-6-like [Artemia franciscana]|uniref:Proteasome subunit beta n=1 Tax=Artemia franciscana TaxID=6661 RepID=A0AA88HJ23_ARTSF|nr:hypothetical protein QYM36_016340 [Artemia franciscana]